MRSAPLRHSRMHPPRQEALPHRTACCVLLLSAWLWSGPARAQSTEPYAAAHRLGISLGFGFGSASLSSFHQGVDDIQPMIERSNPGLSIQGSPKSGMQINAEVAFRYYFPYFVLGQLGCDAIYNRASSSFSFGPATGSLNTDQLILEIPILVGGYYPFLDRLYVFGALGPSPFVYSRSWFSADPGSISLMDLKTDAGVGMQLLAGAEFLLTRALAVGLELRYRYAKTGDLKVLQTGAVATSGMFLGDGSSRTYNLDLSGISLGFTLRIFAL